MIEVVHARFEHVEYLAHNLRAEDRDEIAALDVTPQEALHVSYSRALECFTCLEDGQPIAMWGLGSDMLLGTDTADLWCLTSPRVLRHRKDILRLSRAFVDGCAKRYRVLTGCVDTRYTAAVRWLHWLGFDIDRQFEVNGVAFYLMQKVSHGL